MLPETRAQIFLSDQRLALQNPFALNFHTLPPGVARGETGALHGLSDDRLKPGISLLVEAEKEGAVVLIPWIGDVLLSDPLGKQILLEEGQVYVMPLNQGDFYELRNPYIEEAINFFQLRFAGKYLELGKTFSIALENHPNRLKPICQGTHSLLIGAFDGRAEGVFLPQQTNQGVFFYAIEGAFEVQSRLIEPRDGLALWSVEKVEFEALSEGAVLLVVEI
jgi:quercetin 2,3-dioxygenase